MLGECFNDSSIDSEEREEFRRYLEGTGATEKLVGAFLKLYREPEKPENPIEYIKKCLGDDCPAEKIEQLQEHIKVLNKEQKVLLTEKEVAKGQIKRTPSQELRLITEGVEKLFEEDDQEDDDRMLLQRFLTEELFEELNNGRTTSYGATLYDQIQSGLKNREQEVGIFASDPDAYNCFNELFQPVLEYLHALDSETSQPKMDLEDSSKLEDLDPKMNFVQSIKITINRSLKGYAFMPIISPDKIDEVEKKIVEKLLKIEDENLKGKYFPLIDIEDEKLKEWTEKGIIFPPPEDENLKAAQTYRMWAKGRGIFLNEKNDFRVWVNEEEHMKIIIHEESGNLKAAYEKFMKAIDFFKDLEFSQHQRWGFLAHNLKNIGTTMKISTLIKLPKMGTIQNEAKMGTICDGTEIVADRIDGRGLFELYNLKKVGKTEIDIVKDFQKGIKEFIIAEKCEYLNNKED